MHPVDFEEGVAKILTKDSRYHRDAYLFLREALDHAQKKAQKGKDPGVRHVSGQELLEGVREFALSQFGPMTMTVFDEWGIHVTADFGELVFNMVDCSLLSKTDEDSRDDFKDVYTFTDAFVTPFLPSSKKRVGVPENTPEPS